MAIKEIAIGLFILMSVMDCNSQNFDERLQLKLKLAEKYTKNTSSQNIQQVDKSMLGQYTKQYNGFNIF